MYRDQIINKNVLLTETNLFYWGTKVLLFGIIFNINLFRKFSKA